MSSPHCTTNDETTLYILPSIRQLDPCLPHQAADRSVGAPSFLPSLPTVASASLSRKRSLSPIHSQNGKSSKTSSDSEDDRPLQTPANTTASLEPEFPLKDETEHTRHTYICPYAGCGWSFKRCEHLKRHQLVHTKERPYVCEYPGCGKSFSRSDNYSAHYRTHQRRRSLVDTNPFNSTDINQEKSRLIDRRGSLALGDETRATKVKLESLETPTPDNVEGPLLSPSKTSNIHKLLNGTDPQPTELYRHKRRYSEHNIGTSPDFGQEQPSKMPNWGRSERRHSIAIMTSVSTNFGVSYSSGHPDSHTLPPAVLHHLYPNMHLMARTQPSHLYPHLPSHGQPLAFLANHSMVGTQLATIEELPQHHIPTSTTPRTSNAKNHMCTVAGCNMRFKRLEHLKRHMRVHTLERPFACSYIGCHKTFSRRDNLGQHMRTHERQATKQVQNTAMLSNAYSTPIGLGIGRTGHVRQRSM